MEFVFQSPDDVRLFDLVAEVSKHADRKKAAESLGLSRQELKKRLQEAADRGLHPSAPPPVESKNGFKLKHADLWRGYLEGDRDDPGPLIEAYLPFVEKKAKFALMKYGNYYIYEELLSAAAHGAIDAASGFDPEKGHQFEAFASRHISGRIIDMIRKDDRLTRQDRATLNKVDSVSKGLNRSANEAEIAEIAEVDEQTIIRVRRSTERMTVDDGSAIEIPVVAERSDPDREPLTESWWRRVTFGLTLDEQTIIWLKFRYGVTGRALAQMMGRSESGLSTLAVGACNHIRELHDLDDLEEAFQMITE